MVKELSISTSINIAFKRSIDNTDVGGDHETHISNSDNDEIDGKSSEDLHLLLSGVIDNMTNLNRKSDFVSVLRAIQDGLLDNNIVLYLLLDIGRFYASDCINSMRYDRETMDFWVTFWRLFKGRGINFMGGYKGKGL